MKNSLSILSLCFALLTPSLICAQMRLQDFSCPSSVKIRPGMNKGFITSSGESRDFLVEFPKARPRQPLGVIFSWHGYGDDISNWHRNFNLAAYSTPSFPYIVITPEDTGLSFFSSPQGLGWDLFVSEWGDNNREAELFENVLACLRESYPIDATRIYSAGFSAGALVSNMLYSRYPYLMAAVYSASGLFANDPEQNEAIHVPFGIPFAIDWTPLNYLNQGAVLLTFGNENDSYSTMGFEVVNFHETGLLAGGFLNAHGRVAVTCEHTGAHSSHPAIGAKEVVAFFKLHQAGQPSPLLSPTDLPLGLSRVCRL